MSHSHATILINSTTFIHILLLRLGKSQVTTVGILPNKNSQLACYCLIWGIHQVYGSVTVGQVTVKACFIGCVPTHRLSVFFVLFIYDMQVPNLNPINRDSKEFTM